MKTSFALAVLAFTSTTSAIKLTDENESSSTSTTVTTGVITPESCSMTMLSDIRDPADTSKILFDGWNNAYDILQPMSSQRWPETDIYECTDQSIRNQNNRCLTWSGFSTDESTGANSGYSNWQTCGGENEVNQSFTVVSTNSMTDKLGNNVPIYVFKNNASSLCLTGSGLLTDDCDSGVLHRSKIAFGVYQKQLRNEGTGLCLIPEVNDENARVVSAECEDDYNQQWTSFANKEIAHNATGYCLGTSSGNYGVLSIQACGDRVEQGFIASSTTGKIQFEWMGDETKSLEAVAFEGYAVAPRTTSQSDYQYWQWVDSNEWADAKFEWIEVGCGNGVEMSHSYSEEFTAIDASNQRSQASDDFVLSARDELLGQTLITNAPSVDESAVESLTKTYSDMMNHPSDPTIDRSHLFTCSGENNCMYRSVMTMYNNYELETLEWTTGYTRCLAATPVCPPLTTFDETNDRCVVSE